MVWIVGFNQPGLQPPCSPRSAPDFISAKRMMLFDLSEVHDEYTVDASLDTVENVQSSIRSGKEILAATELVRQATSGPIAVVAADHVFWMIER